MTFDPKTQQLRCEYCLSEFTEEEMKALEVPFAIDRKKAQEMFINWIGKKKYVPASFYDKNQIEKLSGVYFPYLLYSCQVDGRLQGEGERESSTVIGNTRHTEHKRYKVERSSISGYNSVKIQDSETRIRDAKWQYALLPVWLPAELYWR